jgi:superfamily II DNA helicase RecQ
MQLSSCKNAFQARTKLEKMRQLTAWCEDHTRCRRELLLEYFGEAFTGGACCNGMCDNCLFGAQAVALDWCRQAQAVVRIVGSLGDKATMANVVSVVRGCTTPTVKANGWHSLPDFGAGAFPVRARGEKSDPHLLVQRAFFCWNREQTRAQASWPAGGWCSG